MNAPLRLIHELTIEDVNKALRDIQDTLIPPGAIVMSALGTGTLALGARFAAIPGLNLTVPRAGWGLIVVSTNVLWDPVDGAVQVSVSLGGTVVEPDCAQTTSTSAVAKQWTSRLTLGQTVVGKARKLSGAGASAAGVSVAAGNQGSRMDLIWLGP